MEFIKGDIVEFSTRKSGAVKGTFSHYVKSTGLAYIHGEDGKSYERKPSKVFLVEKGAGNNQQQVSVSGASSSVINKVIEAKTPKVEFNVFQRMKFMRSLIRMVIKGKRVSLVVTGEGGLGKTFNVKRELARAGLEEESDYKFIKGYSTAKGLYNTLYEYNGKLLIFDDCDEVLENAVAKNLLKGALDSYDTRQVNWVSQSIASDVPTEFEFTGRIIFISNLHKNKIDQAVLSRSSNIDVSMTSDEKVTYMRSIVEGTEDPNSNSVYKPEINMEDKLAALGIIEEHAHACKNLTMRTLGEIIDYKSSGEEDWELLAQYVMYC